MDFKQLRSFIAVIRYGSFTTAASKLRISQPTVSTHIRQLEEELGMPLVVRNAKRVELTAGGYKMYDQAVAMLAMHDKMLQSIRRKGDTSVYLGASSIPSCYILPRFLAEFGERRPDARFVITQDSSKPVLNGMVNGLYELGFVGMCEQTDALEFFPFYHDRIVIATPNEERFAGIDCADRKAIVRMLRKERIVMRKGGSATRSAAGNILAKLGIEESDLNVVATVNDQDATKNLVESGCGITMLSELSVRKRVEAGRLLAFGIPGVDAQREFYMVKRRNAKLGELAEELFDFIVNNGEATVEEGDAASK